MKLCAALSFWDHIQENTQIVQKRKELQLSSQERSLSEFRNKQQFFDFAFHLLW